MLDWVDWNKTGTYWTVAGGVAGVAAFLWVCFAAAAGWRARRARRQTAAGLAGLLVEAGELLKAVERGEVPSDAYATWVSRAQEFLRARLGPSHAARFRDFSGIMFFGDTSPRSKLRNNLQGHSQRLHEFARELGGRG